MTIEHCIYFPEHSLHHLQHYIHSVYPQDYGHIKTPNSSPSELPGYPEHTTESGKET
jgi:hypothetical protein